MPWHFFEQIESLSFEANVFFKKEITIRRCDHVPRYWLRRDSADTIKANVLQSCTELTIKELVILMPTQLVFAIGSLSYRCAEDTDACSTVMNPELLVFLGATTMNDNTNIRTTVVSVVLYGRTVWQPTLPLLGCALCATKRSVSDESTEDWSMTAFNWQVLKATKT